MAVAVDASTPVRWTNTVTSGTGVASASFTAPTDALLVCCVCFDSDSVTSNPVITVSDSGGLAWTTRVERQDNEATAGGYAGIFTARTTSSVSRTVTTTRTSGGGASGSGRRISAKLYVLTGVDVGGTPVDSVTASNEGGTNTDPTNTTNVTPGANGLLIVNACDWAQAGAITSSNLTVESGDYAGAITASSGYRTCSSGVSVNGNLNPPATPQFKWCQVVVREAAGGGGGRTTRNTRAWPLGMEIGMGWVMGTQI